MSREDVDAFLAECDDVLTDWEGSFDAATWTADGSHEEDADWVELGWTEDGASVYWGPSPSRYTNRAPNPIQMIGRQYGRGARLNLVVLDEAFAGVREAFEQFAREVVGLWDAERHEPMVEGPPDPPRGLAAQRSPYGPQQRRRAR